MKIIIHIALLCITTIAFTQEQKTAHQINVNTSWEGRPRCNGGRGLCAINSSSNTRQANTTIYYYENNKVGFIIDRSKIDKEVEIKIIGIELSSTSIDKEFSYIMNEDYLLNLEAQIILKTSSKFTKIPKGSYPIKLAKDTIIITFNLE